MLIKYNLQYAVGHIFERQAGGGKATKGAWQACRAMRMFRQTTKEHVLRQ